MRSRDEGRLQIHYNQRRDETFIHSQDKLFRLHSCVRINVALGVCQPENESHSIQLEPLRLPSPNDVLKASTSPSIAESSHEFFIWQLTSRQTRSY